MKVHLAMWSGPRNISTAMMRSFDNRPDCYVSDEPFYAYYLKKTGVDHPMKDEIIASGNTNWNEIVNNITSSIPKGKKVWYQKHMAQHNLPEMNLEWVEKVTNCFLIRHPKKVILSYAKKYEINSIFQLGYPQLTNLFELIKKKTKKTPTILNSSDILCNPEVILSKLCNELHIPFYKEMLTWLPGARESDGIWGKYWYGNVLKSTCFIPEHDNLEEIPIKYQNIYDECMEHFQLMHRYRLQV